MKKKNSKEQQDLNNIRENELEKQSGIEIQDENKINHICYEECEE